MCGICGVLSGKITTENRKRIVLDLCRSMIHRGPDDDGNFSYGNISIGMRRLSIIDLKGGSQPLFNEDCSLILVANGEIYNFIELRKKLKEKGHKFKTGSDCEVILHAYEEHGITCLKKLRGMFAFALTDLKSGKLFLVRDRMGEKPIYYWKNSETLIFSSEMKSIVKAVPFKLNMSSADKFITMQYIPEPYTMIEGVKKIEAGHYMEIDGVSGKSKIYKYWDPMESYKVVDVDKFDILHDLENIMEIEMRSDVPVGISLSGGVDSSLLTILAREYNPDIAAFSIGYEGNVETDETEYSQKLSEYLKIPYFKTVIRNKDILNDISKLVLAMDDPIGDIAAYGYYRVAKSARIEGYPVILNGIGADEIFWGYDWIRKSVKEAVLRVKHNRSLWNLTHLGLNYNDHIFLSTHTHYGRNKIIWRKLYKDKFKSELSIKTLNEIDYKSYDVKSIKLKIIKDLFDLWLYPNCNALGDRISMAWSVELRSPFLDFILVEKALGLIYGEKDYLLSFKKRYLESVKKKVPDWIINRKKQGFTPPGNEWKKILIRNFEIDILGGFLTKEGYLDKNYLHLLFQHSITNNEFDEYLYRIIILETWIKNFKKLKSNLK